MARGRTYAVSFSGVSVAAIQDLIAVYCGSQMAIEVHGITIGQITGTTVQNLKISLKRLAAAVTSGSGGSTGSPVKMTRGDASPTVTARVNDTTQATSASSSVKLLDDVFNIVNGYQFFFPPNDIPTIGLSEAVVLSLDTAPNPSALLMSGTLYFAEIL
jgi:hypothetical protein